ncbi:MAG: hypothetical protein DLM69_09550, partial [Candidatus Chloroheliales bacterium]
MDVVSAAEVQAALGQLEAQLRATIEEEEIAGLSAAVVYNQDTIWAKGFGYAKRETQTPATPDTLYRIASITKVFTTTMMMHLRDAGRLQLDDAVAKYLPEYQPKSHFRDAPPTTLRQLASHTAGLPAEAQGVNFNTLQYPDTAQFLASLADVEIIIPPGEIKYSNLGIAILGHALERAAGQPYGEYLRANILAPLGMNRSGLYPEATMRDQLAVSYAPERVPFTLTPPNLDSAALAPAEQMYSSVEDIARFIALQFRDGDNPAGGAQIIAGSSLREMHAPVALDPDWQTGIGIGFALQRLADHTAVVATGGYLGYASNITMIPALKLGVAIFANYLTGAEGIGYAALELLQPVFSAAIDRAESTIPAPAAWQKYVGFYAYPGHKGIDISIAKGKLVITSRLSGNT